MSAVAVTVKRCPRCDGPTVVYYDHRDAWAVCVRCRIGRWVGTGYDRPPSALDPAGMDDYYADTGERQPPAGAIYTALSFWEDVA